MSKSCNGKECGQTYMTRGVHSICPHNNLATLYPQLLDEWDSSNGKAEEYLPGSNKKVLWKCRKSVCGHHKWEAAVYHRVNNRGCPFCAGKKQCPCNSLTLYPQLIKEWHPGNKSNPETHSIFATSRVKWQCQADPCGCHNWFEEISTRVEKKSGCPFCAGIRFCKHTSDTLESLYPQLIPEWHPDNPPMETFAPNSNKKVKWICSVSTCGHHVWSAIICSRTRGNGCPYCSHRNICPCTSLAGLYPEIAAEWDEKDGPGPETYSPNSLKVVRWRCQNSPCSCHTWKCAIKLRTGLNGSSPQSCPFCRERKVCSHNQILRSSYPYLVEEWHPDNPPIDNFHPSSGVVVKWKCSKASCDCHYWLAQVRKRTTGGAGCPFCSNRKLCSHNNLYALYPKLRQEWHPDNPPMENYPPKSEERVKWQCSSNPGHCWETNIFHRTRKSTGCPHCCTNRYSKAQIKWLKEREEKDNVTIQHALQGGEFEIPQIGKVDGYCKKTNTVYEFHGSFWHGHPSMYKGINPVNGKSFAELYSKTVARDQKIRELGYNLVVQWEHPLEEESS